MCNVPNDVDNVRQVQSLSEFSSVGNKNQSANVENAKITLIDLPFLATRDNQNARKRTSNTEKLINTSASQPKKKRLFDPLQNVVVEFQKLISKGPEYVCTSCSQVFFRHSVIYLNRNNYKPNLTTYCVKGTKSVGNEEYICNHCHGYMKKNKVPPCSIGNKLQFPDIPFELQELTQLEQLLVSPRIPFMQIRELPRGGQLGLKGNVVNVPADVNKTVKVIPRNLNESETIPVKFKRSLNIKIYIAFERVRPEKNN